MPNRPVPTRGYERSTALLSRSMLNSPLRDFLADLATRDRVGYFQDFLGDTVDLNDFALAQSQTSVNFTVVPLRNGVIQATAVATTTASVSIVTPAIWFGDANPSFETRLKLNTVASTFIIEAGFIDAVPGSSGPGVVDVDLIAGGTGATMTCGALFAFNNAQTHTSIAFVTAGDFTGQTLASTLVTAASASFTTPVADTYMTIGVYLRTTETGKSRAYMKLNGKLVASHHTLAGGHVDGQQGLAGWIYVQAVAAAAKIVYVDYISITADRGAAE